MKKHSANFSFQVPSNTTSTKDANLCLATSDSGKITPFVAFSSEWSAEEMIYVAGFVCRMACNANQAEGFERTMEQIFSTATSPLFHNYTVKPTKGGKKDRGKEAPDEDNKKD